MRYKQEGDLQRREWVVEAQEWASFDGLEVPSQIQVSWMLPKGKWTWLEVRLTDLKTNKDELEADFWGLHNAWFSFRKNT